MQVAGHPGSVKGYVHIYHLVYSVYLSRLLGFSYVRLFFAEMLKKNLFFLTL